MQDLIILTDKPIRYESCVQNILDHFQFWEYGGGDETSIGLYKNDKGLELWFSPEDVLDDPLCFMGDTVDKCPNKKAYLTNLSYRGLESAKKIVECLKPFYGRMWIQNDDVDDWFGTVDEYLEIYCKDCKNELKNLIILTDKSITKESCYDLFKNNFKDFLIKDDYFPNLNMEKGHEKFVLWFSSYKKLHNFNCTMEELKTKCPNKQTKTINLSYSSKNIAKKVISLLKPLYGRMHIFDEEGNWYGTADEFIEIYCKEN